MSDVDVIELAREILAGALQQPEDVQIERLARAVLSLIAERDQLRAALREACDMWSRGRRSKDKLHIADLRKLAGNP